MVDTVLGGPKTAMRSRKSMRKRSRRARRSIILLASRYAPYDQAKRQATPAPTTGLDKPFDTQQLDRQGSQARHRRTREAGGERCGRCSTTAAAAPVPAPDAHAASRAVAMTQRRAPAASARRLHADVLGVTAKPTQGFDWSALAHPGQRPGGPTPGPLPRTRRRRSAGTRCRLRSLPRRPRPRPWHRRLLRLRSHAAAAAAAPHAERRLRPPRPSARFSTAVNGHFSHDKSRRSRAEPAAGGGRPGSLARSRRAHRLGSRPAARRSDHQRRDRAPYQRGLTRATAERVGAQPWEPRVGAELGRGLGRSPIVVSLGHERRSRAPVRAQRSRRTLVRLLGKEGVFDARTIRPTRAPPTWCRCRRPT